MRVTKDFELFNESQRQALDTRRNLSVRANAGSGKTSVLVERIVQCLAESYDRGAPMSLDSIVAITFTRKAAAELQDRLRASFRELFDLARPDSAERAFWSERIGELPGAMIGTIDSFCSRVLREFGVWDDSPNRIEPDFEPLDEQNAQSLRREAIDRVVNRLSDPASKLDDSDIAACQWWAIHESDHALTRHLMRLLNDTVDPETIVAAHAGLPIASERVEMLWNRLPAVDWLHNNRDVVMDQLQALDDAILGLGKDANKSLSSLREELGLQRERLQIHDTRADADVLGWLRTALLTKDGKRRNQGFSKISDTTGPIQEVWVPLLEEFAFDRDGEINAAEAADRLARLFRLVHTEYLDLCRQAGQYDFLTIARRTRDLLARLPGVRSPLKERFQHVMVDEFQDTNQLQWEILSWIVGDGPDQPLDSNRLFIVGDPQQSIYRFRNAEVGVFVRVQHCIRSSNLDHGHASRPTFYDDFCSKRASTANERLGVVPLMENYRSLKQVPLLLLDRVFRHVFDPDVHGVDPNKHPFEVEYQPLVAGVSSAAVGEIRLVLAGQSSDDTTRVDDEEGRADDGDVPTLQVQGTIDQLQSMYGLPKHTAGDGDEPVLQWRDMAVLLPSRTTVLTRLEEELRHRRIPFVVTKGIGFWQRQEVRDIVSLATYLADAGDELALLAVLRSPLLRLADEEIVFLSQYGKSRLGRGLEAVSLASDESLSEPSRRDAAGDRRHREYWQTVPEDLQTVLADFWHSQHSRDKLRDAHRHLSAWRQRVDRMAHADLLQRALEESSAYAILAAQPDGDSALGNLGRLFDRIRDHERRSGCGMAQLARWMREQVNDSVKEEQATIDPANDAVQIMTIHAAKGLEFPVVALMKMDRDASRSRGESLKVATPWDNLLETDAAVFPDLAPGTLTVSVRHPHRPREPFRPSLLRALHKLDRAQNLAESRRLFYVAATRAKERLILVGRHPESRKPPPEQCWQNWFEMALGLTDEDKARGWWEDPETGARVSIVMEVTGAGEVSTTDEPCAPETLDLAYIRERPHHPVVATTGFEGMRERWQEDRSAWWLAHRVSVTPQPMPPPKDFLNGVSDASGNTIGTTVGSIVHCCFEMGGEFYAQPAIARRQLIEAMATNLLAQSTGNGDEIAAADGRDIGQIVAVCEQIFARLGSDAAGAADIRRLLEAKGQPEVDFALQLGDWRISGRFDKLIGTSASGFEIVDWKTDKEQSIAKIAKKHRSQMSLYALALHRSERAALSDGNVIVHLAMLHPLHVETLRFSTSELESWADELVADLQAMDAYTP